MRFLFPFAPENLISRDRFGRPVSRHPDHSPYFRLNLAVTLGRVPPDFRGGAHLFISSTAIIRHRVSPEFIGSRNCVQMAFTVESPSE